MKKTITFVACMFSSLAIMAQADKYQQAMEKNVLTLDTTTQAQQLNVLLNNFERIAALEKRKWLPYYYAGFCAVKLANLEANLNEVDTKVNRAESFIEKADSLSPNNADVYCLKAMAAFARIKVDFMSRGPKYSMAANEFLLTARQFDPNNPRVYLLIGQNKYGTPEQFGGDKKLGCQLFEKALSLSATPPANVIDPHWGGKDAQRMTQHCQKLTAEASQKNK